MTFYSYMTRNHKGTSTEADWLANAMRMDKERFPKNSSRKLDAWKKLMHDYIKKHPEIYWGSIDAFEECWEEYAKCERNRLKKNSSAL